MPKFLEVLAAGLLLSLSCLPQSPDEQGAKSIFYDTQTGAIIVPKVPRVAVPPHASAGSAKQKPAEKVPAITGLMYHFDLLQPDGQLIRVNANRTFHSGDRIRLHVMANIDGDLTIMQSQDGGPFERLFPSPKLPAGAGRIAKGVDTVLPSAKSWFVFDEHPGELHLMMLLSAIATGQSDSIAGAEHQDSPTATADIASLKDLESVQKGSKALKIETDDSAQQASEVRIVDSRLDSKLPPGQIVVELKLLHRA